MKTALKSSLIIAAAAVLSACGSAGTVSSNEVNRLLAEAGHSLEGIIDVQAFKAAGSTGAAGCAIESYQVTYSDGRAVVVATNASNTAACVITGSVELVADPFSGNHITMAEVCDGIVLKCKSARGDMPAVTGPFEPLKQHSTMRAYGQQYERIEYLKGVSERVDVSFASMNRERRRSFNLCSVTLPKVLAARDRGAYRTPESLGKIARLEAECGHWMAATSESAKQEMCVASATNQLQRNACVAKQ